MRHVPRLAAAAFAAAGLQIAAAGPLAAQTPSPAPAEKPAGPVRYSVQSTPVSVIIADPKAKAALEAVAPDITGYYKLIGKHTLTQVAALSGGQLDDEMLKRIQAAFDKL